MPTHNCSVSSCEIKKIGSFASKPYPLIAQFDTNTTLTMLIAKLTLDQALLQALNHHRAGRLREAEGLYRSILQASPNQADAHHNLGVLAVQVNQLTSGLLHFKKALEANQDQAQYWLSYIDALIQSGQITFARQTLEQGLQRGLQGEAVEVLAGRLVRDVQLAEPLNAEHQRGRKELPDVAVNAPEKNKKKSKTISSHQQGSSPSHQEIGALGVLFSGGMYDKAASQAYAMTARYPKHGFTWKVLGAALRQTGRREDALAAIQKATFLSPEDAEAHINLGLILGDIGRLDESAASHRRALELKPDYVEGHYNLGNVLKDMGRLSEAVASYKRALRVKPDFANVHNNLGATLMDMGLLDEAEECYRRALELEPDYVEGHYNLGNVLKDMGRLSEAVASYKRALGVKPDLAEAINNLGATHKEMGRLEEAEVCYRQALKIKPDFFLALCNLGVVLREIGKLPNAVDCFRQALDIKPVSNDNLVTAHIGLAETLARQVSGWHVPMMNDSIRNKAYQDALRSAVTPETNALEIGTGSGLLAMMTARFGAGQITTCEAVPLIAAKAQEIIEVNDLSSLIRVIPKKSTEIQVGSELPQRANLLVSEIFSSELLGEGVLSSIEDAKRRLLTRDAIIIPAVGKIVFALFGGEGVKKSIYVDEVCGFDLSKFNDISSQKRMLYRNDLDVNLLTEDTEGFAFDFTKQDYFPNESKIVRLPIIANGRCYGAIQWIRLQMDDDIVFENHPSIKAEASGWQQCLYRFPAPVDVVAGQTAVITVAHNRAAVWFTLDSVE